MKPTIKDVAAAANVSIATVSRILNNQSGYSEQTKEKVVKVIKEIGFQPSAVARGLVSKKNKDDWCITAKCDSFIFGKVIEWDRGKRTRK